jgi:dCTP deaminase
MILSDLKILKEIEKGNIIIEPFDSSCLGSNSYDVHLSKHLAVYKEKDLDCKIENELIEMEIGENGKWLFPNTLYLGSTIEYTETLKHVPFIEGKSSIGRLGINIHATAGKGDVGFCNHWTLEISVIQPVKVYAGMPIGQLIYFHVKGKVETPYFQKKSAKYIEISAKPQGSKMHKNF